MTEVLVGVSGPPQPPGLARRPRAAVAVDAYVDGVLAGNRTMIARSITLVESSRADHQAAAQRLLVRLLPHAGAARRVGITGVPGVGKSTFIDALGTSLTRAGHRVAVLAVDPSSTRTGGSILGDKTRMAALATDPNAFIRPSPTAGTLGGVAKATREAIVVMEAAGYDVVLVETVGVGQSETTVAEMVDTFLFLTLARTGDQLQGIKKGVLELADVIAVNKADGPHEIDARRAARELSGALRLLRAPDNGWRPPVLTCSALEHVGLDEVWAQVVAHQELLDTSGELAARRRRQQVEWTWAMVRDRLLADLHRHPRVLALAPELERRVREGSLTPSLAADAILTAYAEPEPEPDRGRDLDAGSSSGSGSAAGGDPRAGQAGRPGDGPGADGADGADGAAGVEGVEGAEGVVGSDTDPPPRT